MTRGVNDVHPNRLAVFESPIDCAILRENGDATLPLQRVGIEDAFLAGRILPKCSGLSENRVDERGLAVVNVGDDGDVTDGSGR